MIPVCDYVLYPLMARVGLTTNLHKMTVGGFLGVVAIMTSGFLELIIQNHFISIFWLVPQYLILALSENFMTISNNRFAYAEAPGSMKSAMQAFVLIVTAFGNLIVAIVSGFKLFSSNSVELFFFSGLLFVSQIIFGILASKYQSPNKDFHENSVITTKM